MQASFTREFEGPSHQDTVPEVAEPESCPNRDELRGRDKNDAPIDVRMATPITESEALPPEQHIWLKPTDNLPENPNLHLALLIYASDRTPPRYRLETSCAFRRTHRGQSRPRGMGS